MRSTDLIWFGVLGVFFAATWLQTRATRRSADVLLKSNRKIAKDAAVANYNIGQALESIHALVNSNLTEAQRHELEATRVMLASLREIVRLKESQGISVTAEAFEAIRIADARVAELSHHVGYKQQQTVIAETLSPKHPVT